MRFVHLSHCFRQGWGEQGCVAADAAACTWVMLLHALTSLPCTVPQAPSGTAMEHGSAAATPHAGRWRR